MPTDWTDEEVTEFANRENPCGTTTGWHIRKAGDELLQGSAERTECSERSGFVHLMLDA